MKVVFLESVEGTAEVGEVKDVKNGFARNYLLPRGLAGPAVKPYLRRAEARAAREAKHQNALDMEAGAVAERIEGSRITMVARVGEQGKLFGSVTGVHIAAEVAKLLGSEDFDHRKVLLPEAIKETGIQPIRLRMTRNIEATIEVEVIGEGEEPQAEAEEEAEDEAEPQAEAEEGAEDEAEPQDEAGQDDNEATPSDEPEATAEEDESDDTEAEEAEEEQ